MKRIDIGKGYFIDVDEGNFTLKSNIKESISEDGKKQESCTTHGYYGTLEAAIKSLVKLKMIDKINGVVTLPELREIILEIHKEIDEIIKPLRISV